MENFNEVLISERRYYKMDVLDFTRTKEEEKLMLLELKQENEELKKQISELLFAKNIDSIESHEDDLGGSFVSELEFGWYIESVDKSKGLIVANVNGCGGYYNQRITITMEEIEVSGKHIYEDDFDWDNEQHINDSIEAYLDGYMKQL